MDRLNMKIIPKTELVKSSKLNSKMVNFIGEKNLKISK